MVVTKRKVDETIKDDEAKDDIVQEKKPRLEGQALLELRQRLRQRKKMFKLMPDFRLKPIGLDARLEIASDIRKRLTMKDLQNLLLYSILGTSAPVEPSRLVNKYIYFVIEGWQMGVLVVPLHRGVFCQFPVRWIYYCHCSKSTRKESGKMQLCALVPQIFSR